MTTVQQSPVTAAGLASLAFSRRVVNKLVDACPENSYTHQACEGANHVTWNLGHLAWTDDYFLTALAGQASSLPAGWAEKFGMQTKPVGDSAAYPPAGEVRRVFNETRERLIAWFESMDDEQLGAELPDNLKGFAPTFGALMGSMAAHEGMHAGQITVARRSLGLNPVME